MSLLRNIKTKIAAVEAYLRSNNAMKSVASVRISKYKKKINSLESVNLLKSCYSFTPSIKKEKTNLHILIGCNQGMCGVFLNNIFHYIRKTIKEKNKDDIIYILGEKFLDYNLRCNVFTNRLILTDIGLFCIVSKFFNEIVLKKNIANIFLHYYDKKVMKKELILEDIDLTSKPTYTMLFIISKIMRGAFISGFYENKERVFFLEQAKSNAEKMLKKGYNELNRVRQEAITNDLAEIVAGVLI